jgi:prepilin-type N-terminal cleavage/methylation domain-containing protein
MSRQLPCKDGHQPELARRTMRGFSLLEVIISLAIITTLAVALTTMMRSSFDIREGLSENSRVNHRLAASMSKVVHDLMHAYVISEKEVLRTNNIDLRIIKTLFQIESSGSAEVLRMTTMSHVPRMKNANESDSTFVVYRLQENSENGRTNLMRGESKRKPEDFRDDPKLRVLAENIKAFRIQAWRGDDWMKDRWDSTRGDTKGMMPRMVKVEIESYPDEAVEGDRPSQPLSSDSDIGPKVSTVVTLPMAMSMNEVRASTSTIRWEKL